MEKSKFYVLTAANGVFIHTSYRRAVWCRDKYFKAPAQIKRFTYYDDASAYALEHLDIISDLCRQLPEVIELDKFYFSHRLPITLY